MKKKIWETPKIAALSNEKTSAGGFPARSEGYTNHDSYSFYITGSIS
jgi:hypothetical protein